VRPNHVSFGALRRLSPISERWGFDRGTPIDRHYIDRFLAAHAKDIRGNVLEIGDATYTRRFGTAVEKSDVLDVGRDNPEATIVADLARGDELRDAAFDCAIVTQTLHLIYDISSALTTLRRLLVRGGILLATFPGITRIGAESDWGATWHWSVTSVTVRRLFNEVFGENASTVEVYGNVLAAVAFLHGIAAEELREHELAYHDTRYQVLVAARAVRE
jgi:hypothetical protein